MSKIDAHAETTLSFSLQKFTELHLARPGEWDEFVRVKDAAAPRDKAVWKPNKCMPDQQDLVHVGEVPSPDYLLRERLQIEFVERLRHELLTGKWSVRGIPPGAVNRAEIATELALEAVSVSFLGDRIGSFAFVEIRPLTAESRFLRLKAMIEEICAAVPAKQRFGKEQVEAIADRLLPFDVRNDVFKAAWAEAQIPSEYKKPGP